jgi:dihydrofolate reductase
MKLIALAAMADNRIIGKDGKLPWHISGDLKFFKRTTMGHAILFGRTTFEGIGRALPGRTNLVLSGTMPPRDDVKVVRSVEELLQRPDPLVFVCGGARVYAELFPRCAELFLTRVQGEYEGDVTLPPFEDLFRMEGVAESGEGYTIEHWLRVE